MAQVGWAGLPSAALPSGPAEAAAGGGEVLWCCGSETAGSPFPSRGNRLLGLRRFLGAVRGGGRGEKPGAVCGFYCSMLNETGLELGSRLAPLPSSEARTCFQCLVYSQKGLGLT